MQAHYIQARIALALRLSSCIGETFMGTHDMTVGRKGQISNGSPVSLCVACWLHQALVTAGESTSHVLQALQEARARSAAASGEVQRINKEVSRLEVAIPKLQLEAGAARQQATDLQHRLAQLSQAAQVSSSPLVALIDSGTHTPPCPGE